MGRLATLLILLFPLTAIAATSDPTGVSDLVFMAILFLPLIILVWIGASMAGLRGVLGGFIIYVASIGILRTMAHLDEAERSRKYAIREKAIAACVSELAGIHNEYTVDSLAIESGKIELATLKSLIGEQGLKFVALKTQSIPTTGEPGQSKQGATILDGDEAVYYHAAPDIAYIRFSLGRNNDPLCDERATRVFGLDRPIAPFSPDACIVVQPESGSGATHALRAIRDAHSIFSHWTLVEQATGKSVFALTTNDSPTSPGRQRTENRQEVRQVRFGQLSCREPHFSMTRALYRSQADVLDRLTLNRREITPSAADSPDGESALPELLSEQWQIFDWGKKVGDDRPTYEWNEDWANAFRAARNTGWADVGSDLIDYRAGELLSLGGVKYRGEWLRDSRAASKHGFVLVAPLFHDGKQDLLLLRYALDGALQWKGFIHPKSPQAGASAFEPVAVTWRNGEIHIFGFRRTTKIEVQTWLFNIPEASLGVMIEN